MILYQLAYGGIAPFSTVPGGRLGKLKAVISPDVPVDMEPLEDGFLLNVLRRCLDKDPYRRAGVDELLVHPFLRPPPAVTEESFCLNGNSSAS